MNSNNKVLTYERESACRMFPERCAGGADVALRAMQAALAAAVSRTKLHAHTHVAAGSNQYTLLKYK